MPIYKIRGIDVDFPFEAYDCQIVYMEKVIQSLQERCNALLESPTGTGKTLCLLCATLAWRKSLGDFSTGLIETKGHAFSSQHIEMSQEEGPRRDLPVIIYTSRTHSQLQQVIKELKTSNYRPKMIIFGSREQMCIHDEVQFFRGHAQNNACHYLRKKRSCKHYTCVSEFMKNNPGLGNEPFDIEDLANIGRKQGPCPYYVSRELHKSVDILFAPYNYLIDTGNRRSLTGIQWDNTVLIFDEAHNLESICADAASFDLPSGYLSACISEAKQCVDLSHKKRAIEKSDDKVNPENFAILGALLLKLEKRIAEVPIESKELGFTRPGPYIYELFADLNITHGTAKMLIDTIDQAALLLEDARNESNKNKGTVCRLETMRDILKIIFKDDDKSQGNLSHLSKKCHANCYRVHVHETQGISSGSLKASRTLSWWCFNPGISMEEFSQLGVRSVIVTSGTLSPLDSFAFELKLSFPVRIENPHVISSSQIWVGVVPTGPSGCPFNSSYRNRDSLEYKQELGNAIVNFARIVPDGLLVFFPSYYLMDQCIDSWKNMGHSSSTNLSTIWERICKHKQPVVEPKQSSLFPCAIEDFKKKLNDTYSSGAIFLAVCRGKVSEGLDFADHAGRAVVVTGMPFAMRTDPKIRLKREFLDQQASSIKRESLVLTGEEWYSQEAARAVNQAIGRVIRHRNDYGAIIFCDERFSQQSRVNQMSLWLRPYVKCYPKFGDAMFTLSKFFRERSTCSPLKPIVPEKLSAVNAKEVRIHQLETNIFSAQTSSVTTRVVDSKRSLTSMLAVAANRAALSSNNQSHQRTTKKSGESFYSPNMQTVHVEKKDSLCGDYEVVDLTGDDPLQKYPGTEKMIISSKKPKTFKSVHEVSEYSENHLSKQLLTGVTTYLPKKSLLTIDAKKHCEQALKGSSCMLEKMGISSNRNTVNVEDCPGLIMQRTDFDHLDSSSKDFTIWPCGNEEKRGSDFLNQVQEKLTAEEYNEFVGFMKALKSGAMKIMPALDSISKLFSTPGRLDLLRRFKDFVPAKYQPIYEQYVRAPNAAGSEGS